MLPYGGTATTAGLILGCKAAGLKTKVIGVVVEPEGQPGELKNNIKRLFAETNKLLHAHDPSFPIFKLAESDINLNHDYCGPGYGIFTKEGANARAFMKNSENIMLDGTYSAKAFAGVIADIKAHNHQKSTILFWQTYCGLDFTKRLAKTDYKKFPVCFHTYFETDVQELDKS